MTCECGRGCGCGSHDNALVSSQFVRFQFHRHRSFSFFFFRIQPTSETLSHTLCESDLEEGLIARLMMLILRFTSCHLILCSDTCHLISDALISCAAVFSASDSVSTPITANFLQTSPPECNKSLNSVSGDFVLEARASSSFLYQFVSNVSANCVHIIMSEYSNIRHCRRYGDDGYAYGILMAIILLWILVRGISTATRIHSEHNFVFWRHNFAVLRSVLTCRLRAVVVHCVRRMTDTTTIVSVNSIVCTTHVLQLVRTMSICAAFTIPTETKTKKRKNTKQTHASAVQNGISITSRSLPFFSLKNYCICQFEHDCVSCMPMHSPSPGDRLHAIMTVVCI